MVKREFCSIIYQLRLFYSFQLKEGSKILVSRLMDNFFQSRIKTIVLDIKKFK